MKAKNISFLVLCLWMLVIQTIYTEDTCQSGMRKMYLDETTAYEEGSARNYVPAINFYEGSGALWYRRRVLIEPRFEVHLKAALQKVEVIESSKEQTLEGFTIVISRDKNRLSSASSDYLGYYGFTKSYIIEFDFNKGNHDPDDSSYSFRFCDNDCSNDDSKAIVSGKLSLQRFDPTRDMNWDFRLIYGDKKLTLLSGANQQIFSHAVDLAETLQTYTAYVGFTGHMSGNRRELNVLGTFVCEDNFDISRMSGKFYVNEKEYETYTFEGGENVQYLFSFINTKGQIVPHCFKQGIWTYSFALSLDCRASNYNIRMKDEYSLLLTMNACTEIGKHSIGISEASHGVGPEKEYTIKTGSLNKIVYIGHDGKKDTSLTKVENEYRILSFGTDNGDFSLKGEYLEIVLDFAIIDKSENKVDLGTTSSQMISKSNIVCNGGSSTLTMRSYEDHYQVVIKVTQAATYTIIKNSYMDENIRFKVVSGGIDASASYCSLDGFTSSPNLKIGDTIKFNCYFKDGRGNDVTIQRFNEISEYDFSSEVKETFPASKTFQAKYNDKTKYYQAEYKITENGIFQFYGYLTLKGKTTRKTLTGRVYQFYVSSDSSTLTNSKIFNYFKKEWVSIDSATIYYRNDKTGRITAIDLADSTGTLMSKYKKYPTNFDATKIKVEFYSDHDRSVNVGDYYAKVYNDGGIEYIGIFNKEGKESDQYLKRSSFDYTLKITYQSVTKIITFKYDKSTLNIGTYTTCFHSLELSKTKVNIDKNVQIKTNGQYTKIGTIELRTTDGYLYNYKYDINQIKVGLTATGDVKFQVKQYYILGIYEIWALSTTEYTGEYTITIGQTVVHKEKIVAQQSYAYKMKFTHSEYFKQIKQEGNSYYYEYTGDFTTANLGFDFQLLDDGNGVINKEDYFSKYADVYYMENGKTYTGGNYYTITYEKNGQYYKFVDKFKYESKIYTWVFHFKEGNNQVKYYITYDQKKIKQQISVENSYFKIVTSEVKINSYVTIDVFLIDGNGSFMGMTNGKLEELKGNVVVKAVYSDGREAFRFNYYQTTTSYAIRYQNKVTVGGEFKIVAYYKNEEIKCKSDSSTLKITVAQYSLKHSKFSVILDKTIKMESGTEITIENSYQTPKFTLELYTEKGEKTTYSSDSKFSLTLTKGSKTITFTESKSGENIQFNFDYSKQDVFKTLSGDSTLTLTSGSQSISWTIHLIGDGSDYSDEKEYDLSKTYIEPVNAVAVAGEETIINIQLRGKDGKRWNGYAYDILWKFTLENSYKLEKNKGIKWEFSINYNNLGNIILKITQDVITTKGDNILTIKLQNDYTFETKINFKVKSGEFSKLKVVEEVSEGDVINPPSIKFEPVDAKGNLVTDFFDGSVTKEYLNSLTVGKSLEGISLISNNYVSENKYLIVQYKSTISTNVKVTSQYFSETYNYRIKSGPIDLENTYAEMATRESGASGDYKILIYPRDKYMNDIDNLSETHMKQFLTYYQKVEENSNVNVKTCKLVAGHMNEINVIVGGETTTEEKEDVEYNSIECSTPIDYIGNIAFHVTYTNTEIECKNCVFSVIFSEFDWSNTKTFYKNKEYYLDIEKVNEVEAKKEPVFEVTFFDQHKNVLEASSVEKLNLIANFEGADVRFCVANSGNKKVLTLCPATGGDDNINKWQYITNGDNYKLTIQQKEVKENSFTYKIKIIGGGEGSSEPADYSKTNFNPTKITIIAGEEGQTTMEIRTAKSERKNYWFPNISEKIKVAFDQDQDYCSYKVERGNLPGQYLIKVSCTKENENNSFSVTVEGKKVEQKIQLVVNSGKAYYLQVVETSKFNAVSDQYTWKINPTNDDDIDFTFKLLDKNKNEIPHSVIGKNEITISSDKFGTTQTYYKLEYNESKNTYTLIDNIKQAITKHVWTITVIESNKKYTFVYTRLPGKVDVTKSSYTIDKKDYILNEKSTVVVTLRDRYSVNVATEEGRLVKEETKTQVVTKDTKDTKEYKYTSKVEKLTISYTYTYVTIGKYEVTVTYDGKQIGTKTDVTVSYQTVDTKTSKLYYDKGDNKETFMSTTSETNIDNLHYTPFYKFYLYTSAGERITVYDKSVKVTCEMRMVSNDEEKWELDVSQGDAFFKFAYKDGNPDFVKLPGVSYNLIVNYGGKEIVYPLLLLGEKDVSPDRNYDTTNTYIEPTYKEGIAGVQYEFNLEFRAKDKLRWNYEVNLNSLVITNSYKLDDKKLKIDKKLGEKNGQVKLLITQYVSYTNFANKDNVLTLTYESKAITQKITLHIKHADLKVLEYVDGAKDGTVVNPSIVKFIPKDAYGNLFTDLFNEKVYTKTKLEGLTKATSVEKYDLTTNNYVSEGKYLNVQYGCKKVTTIKLTVEYNTKAYTYKLWSGPIDAEHSYGQLEKTEGVKAGDQNKLDIYPRDIYDNVVTNVTSDDLSKFLVNYEVNKESKTEVTKTCNVNSMKDNADHFSCQTTITKSGKIEFIIDYDNSNVKCKQCSLEIKPDKLDFDKTKVIYTNENTELSRTEVNSLTVTVVPNFELFFYDKYENQIVDKTEVNSLVVTTDIVVTDVKLCVANKDITKTSTLCKSENNSENERKWSYVPNGDNYKLIVKETTTNKEVTFKIKITGGFNDGDSGPIDTSKTYIQPTSLTLTAGVEGSVLLELRTAEGKRKNYWYENAKDNISVKFPDDVKNCTYSLAQSTKPGQYNIKYLCTIKRDAFKTTVTVEGKELSQKVTLTVVPAEPAKSKLFKTTGEEITQKDLGSVSVEDKYQMIEKLFDKYDNLITNLDGFKLSNLELKIAPYTSTKLKYNIDSSIQANGEILITITSQFASKHAVAGKYFPKDYYDITFTHGVPDASNSRYLVSKTEIFVGEEVKVYVYAYDKYNNYIDANEFKETSPYQVKYNNEKENTMKVFTEKYSIEKKDDLNVLSYPGTFFIKGTSTVWTYLDTKQIICDVCRVNVKTKDIEFGKSIVLRYESTKKDFETLKNGTVEKNTKEYPVYRLYPRDEYENTVDVIPDEALNKYTAHFKSQNSSTVYTLKLNNKGQTNQAYAEFVANDTINSGVEWETLVGGYYDLVFEYSEKKIVYNITIEGDGKGGSNDPADNQHTNINEMNLKYVAGKQGYMILEMRTKDNIRRNSWDEGLKFDIKSCDSSDETFSFKQENAGTRGVYYITVTTKKANTYPKLIKCPLTISVNGELIKNLKPEMEVSPDVVVKTEILKKYYKDGKSSDYLVDGNADKPYSFEVNSFDQYGNLAETIQEDIELKVSYINGNSLELLKDLTSATNTTTGFRKYTVTVSKSGTYVISTDRSGPKGLYLEKESKFNVLSGDIDLSKTIVRAKDSPIKAGSKAAITIECYDKNSNPLKVENYQDKFTATFVDAGNTKHESKSGFDELLKKVVYTTVTSVTIVGNVKVTVLYDKKQKVDTSKVVIVVIPADPDPINSVLSREVSSNRWVQYKNGDSFNVDTNDMLLLNITLYDKYNNKIPSIPNDAQVVNPLMSGNDMSEIKFTVVKNTANFDLHFNSNGDYVHTYQHLTSGTYDLTYTVKTTLGDSPFKYHVIIKKDDNGHGNGPYDLAKCVLKPKNVSFVAGNYEHFTLELRTTKGLLYNDNIDIEKDIEIKTKKVNKPIREDKTFKYSIEKTTNEYGIYTITIYSEKKGEYDMDVNLANPFKNKTKENVGPAHYTVYPEKVPHKNFTVFFSKPEGRVPAESIMNITFTLADRFDNLFEGRHDCVDEPYLTLLNNEVPLKVVSMKLKDEMYYEILVKPKYPPKNMSMNVIYNDGDDTVYCFPENINVYVVADIDFTKTRIVSRNKDLIYVGDMLDMWLYTFDKLEECYDEQDYSKSFKIEVVGPTGDKRSFTKNYSVRRTNNKELECNNEYQIITKDPDDIYTISGYYVIRVFADEKEIAKYDQLCLPLGYSKFYLELYFDKDNVSVLDINKFKITGTDKYGNRPIEPLIDDIEITLTFIQDNSVTNITYDKFENKITEVDFDLSVHKVGKHQMHLYYKKEEVLVVNEKEDLPILTVLNGPCRAETNEHFNTSMLTGYVSQKPVYFKFQCYDVYNNKITKGGEKFTAAVDLVVDKEITPTNFHKVEDNGDGSYNVYFLPDTPGKYIIRLKVDDGIKYGQDVEKDYEHKVCKGATPVMCPNYECAADYYQCVVPPNGCPKATPFKCPVGGVDTCVKSQIECDCPPGWIKCDYMKYCVPGDKPWMCPNYKLRRCQQIESNWAYFADGICRDKDYVQPTQIVCPYGKVLCADLTCADNHYLCANSTQTPLGKTRCVDQQVTKYAYECASTITCPDKDQVVCSDGSCVENEIFCPPIRECPYYYPYLCNNNVCVADKSDCMEGISCGDGNSLCYDYICRERCDTF